MRKWKTLILTAALTVGIGCLSGAKAQASSIKIDQVNFPDASIRTYVTRYDTDKDGMLSDAERAGVKTFSLYWGSNHDLGLDGNRKVDFEGIQHFTAIKEVSIDLRYGDSHNLSEWDYKNSNLTKYFPNMESLEICAKQGQRVELSGEYASLKKIEVSNAILSCTMKAPKVSEVNISATYIDNNAQLGTCFPNAKYVTAYDCNLGKGDTLSGFCKLQRIILDGKKLTSINLKPLKDSGKTLKSIEVRNATAKKVDFSPLKKAHLDSLSIKNVPVSKLDLSPLKNTGISWLEIQGCPVKKLELSPLKDSLKILRLGDDQYIYGEQDDADKYYRSNKKLKAFHTLDLSQMKKLQKVYACGAWNIQSVKLADVKKKTSAKSLRELHLYGTNIKSLNASGVPNLRRLFVGNYVKKLDVSKCKKLYELGMINKGTTNLSLKSKSLKHLQYAGKKGNKLDLSNCPKLCSFAVRGLSISTLDLSKNQSLSYMEMRSVKVKTLKMPCLKRKNTSAYHYKLVEKNDVIPNNGEIEGIDGIYADFDGYDFVNGGKIGILDLSGYTKLSAYTKKQQLAKGFDYNKYFTKKCKIKKIVINKNLRKADKKWVKKMAKKQKIKVVEK